MANVPVLPAHADAPVAQVEDAVPVGRQRPPQESLDDREHAFVQPQHCAREDVRPKVGLVGVYAHSPDTFVLRRAKRAEAADPGDVEYDT